MLIPAISWTATSAAAEGASIAATVSEASLTGSVFVFSVASGPSTAVSGDALPNDSLKPLLRDVRGVVVGPFSLAASDAAASLFDAGASQVLFSGSSATSGSAEPEMVEEAAAVLASIPAGRAALLVDGWPAAADSLQMAAVASLARNAASVWFALAPEQALPASDAVKAIVKALPANVTSIAVVVAGQTDRAITAADVGRLHAAGCGVVASAVVAPTAEASEALAATARQPLDIGPCFAACARSDRPDGLYTTVVVDEGGVALGLVYSSSESIAEAVRCKRGVYYSRSRGGLWRKGDSSGAVQQLLGMRLDCDSDALYFSVRQLGAPPAFCHLNTRTCWGEDSGLPALQRVLESRRASAPAGSYTKRLFDDGALLKHKLLEEAQELAEAEEPDHVAAEVADVVYFALVKAVKHGVGLAEVCAHLDRRALKISRRPGNAKAERIAAAEAHFKAVAEAKAATAAAAASSAGAPAGGAADGAAVGGAGAAAAAAESK